MYSFKKLPLVDFYFLKQLFLKRKPAAELKRSFLKFFKKLQIVDF